MQVINPIAIAQQCPFAGGGVVYKARDFLRRVNDSLEYYDDAVCVQYGIFRVATTTGQVSEDINIKLIPNPASSIVDVIVYPAFDELCSISIFNSM